MAKTEKRPVYEVAVDAPLAGSLIYDAPAGYSLALPAGSIVRAPLGSRQVTGYVLGEADAPEGVRLRPLADVLSAAPFFPAGLVPFYRWIANYYHFPIGEVIRTALPLAPGLRATRHALLTAKGRAFFACPENRARYAYPWLDALVAEAALDSACTGRIWKNAGERAALGELAHRGLIRLERELAVAGGKARMGVTVKVKAELAPFLRRPDIAPEAWPLAGEQAPLRQSEKKLLTIFQEMASASGNDWIFRASLAKTYPNYAPALKSLCARGLLTLGEERIFRDPFAGVQTPAGAAAPPELSTAQKDALKHIGLAIQARTFSPFLLFGVTGSGKTEVYLQAIAQTLAQGRNALVLAPEITLAVQLESALRARFASALAVLHSGMGNGERLDQWRLVSSGQARIVLGARSAVFAPLTNLGLVVVDEEHESAYKQEDGLSYHGRDLAVVRARQAGCPVVLGSATPTLTSYHNAVSGKYRLLRLPERVSGRALPRVALIDMKAQRAAGASHLFSAALLSALRQCLANGRQALLFLNRRGFATFMQCQDCGLVLECPHCRVSLTLHRTRNILLCHYCGYQRNPAVLCPGCGSERVIGRGSGTERVEEEIAKFFPSARVMRIDSDTGGGRRRLLELLHAMRAREIDILVGTQMIAKGLHFPAVSLVGVLWADAGLALPDFRASERAFAQLVQVIGRAGRGESPGQVLVQTWQPDHYAHKLAATHDYEALYETESGLRRQLGYPPFTRLVNVRISGPDEREVERVASLTAGFLREQGAGVSVLGPAPAPLVKIKDLTRWQILLKSADTGALHRLCAALYAQKKILCPAGLALQIDVDPENML